MKRATLAIVALLAFASCGGSSLIEPMAYDTACGHLETSVREKCEDLEEFKCEEMITCDADSDVETVDIEECVTNIKNSKDCAAATKIYCAIACEE
ncbi:MAG: hypothetical protein PHQ00_02935 [Phycisphaerae bacterium]|nr:hypothetical protein [Phycisphaerae bacterium]